jgi:hypothetical protein
MQGIYPPHMGISYPLPQSNDHQSRGPTRGRTKKCGPTRGGGGVVRQAGNFYQNMRKSCGPTGGRSLDKEGGGRTPHCQECPENRPPGK